MLNGSEASLPQRSYPIDSSSLAVVRITFLSSRTHVRDLIRNVLFGRRFFDTSRLRMTYVSFRTEADRLSVRNPRLSICRDSSLHFVPFRMTDAFKGSNPNVIPNVCEESLENTCFVCAFRYSAFRNNRGIDNSIKSFKEVYLSIFAVSREAIFCLFVIFNAAYSLMYHENKPLNFHFIRHKNHSSGVFSGKRGRMSGLFVFEDVINLK